MSGAFDGVVRHADPAMVVVTTVAAGERAGCLVGIHAQSSIEPRRYVVWAGQSPTGSSDGTGS